jgi:Reverse transcriptase (RNA-dependent DNA polymerase)
METYAPTASLATFRLLVAISVFNGWQLRNLDIITSFLNGDIDTDVYMGVPEGMDVGPRHYVLKLRRSLYGLKQATRIWWKRCATSCFQHAHFIAARLSLLSFSDPAEIVSSFFSSLLTMSY